MNSKKQEYGRITILLLSWHARSRSVMERACGTFHSAGVPSQKSKIFGGRTAYEQQKTRVR